MDFAKGNNQECLENPVQQSRTDFDYFGVFGGRRIENGGEEVLIKVGMLIIVFSFAENTNRAKPISFGPKYNLLLVLLLIQFKNCIDYICKI